MKAAMGSRGTAMGSGRAATRCGCAAMGSGRVATGSRGATTSCIAAVDCGGTAKGCCHAAMGNGVKGVKGLGDVADLQIASTLTQIPTR